MRKKQQTEKPTPSELPDTFTMDEQKIKELSGAIVANAFEPKVLWDHVTNHVDDEPEFEALCIALDSRYPAAKAKAATDDHYTDDGSGFVALIEQEAMYHIGVAVGRRLR